MVLFRFRAVGGERFEEAFFEFGASELDNEFTGLIEPEPDDSGYGEVVPPIELGCGKRTFFAEYQRDGSGALA